MKSVLLMMKESLRGGIHWRSASLAKMGGDACRFISGTPKILSAIRRRKKKGGQSCAHPNKGGGTKTAPEKNRQSRAFSVQPGSTPRRLVSRDIDSCVDLPASRRGASANASGHCELAFDLMDLHSQCNSSNSNSIRDRDRASCFVYFRIKTSGFEVLAAIPESKQAVLKFACQFRIKTSGFDFRAPFLN